MRLGMGAGKGKGMKRNGCCCDASGEMRQAAAANGVSSGYDWQLVYLFIYFQLLSRLFVFVLFLD